MKIKVDVILKDEQLLTDIVNVFEKRKGKYILNKYKNIPKDIELLKKTDIIIYDEAVGYDWIKFHEEVKHLNINNIFIVITDCITFEKLKKGYKEGVYDFIRKNNFKKEVIYTLERAIETALILKSKEKVNKFCKHFIEIEIPSDPNLVNETVLQIINTAKICGFINDQDSETNIRLALTEALVNAIIHGNKSDLEKKVIVKTYIDFKKIEISIKDMGAGFDFQKTEDPLAEDNILKSSGRGIYLIKLIMDAVEFKEAGREIILTKFKQG